MISTSTSEALDYASCPNKRWNSNVVEVIFDNATLTLLEDDVKSDLQAVHMCNRTLNNSV